MSLSPLQLLIIFGIAVLLFGTKKLRNMGSDLGSAVKGFKEAVKDEDKPNSNDKHRVLDHEKVVANTTTDTTDTKVEDKQNV